VLANKLSGKIQFGSSTGFIDCFDLGEFLSEDGLKFEHVFWVKALNSDNAVIFLNGCLFENCFAKDLDVVVSSMIWHILERRRGVFSGECFE
jgi:hypothetical protein